MNNREFDRCMRRMQKGDKTGLKEIYEAYISYIYAVIRGVVKNKENAALCFGRDGSERQVAGQYLAYAIRKNV